MKTTQTIGALAAALAKAQGGMVAASLDRINPHFKSKYATLASIIDAARAPLAANGLSVCQGASVIDGRVVVTTLLMHASGESIEDSLSIKPAQDTAQGLGSAITYGRRYAYAAMLGIVSDEDDDGEAATNKPRAETPKPAAVPTQKPAVAPTPAAKDPAIEQRNAAVRRIFEMSASLGETSEQMQARMGQLITADKNAKPLKSTKDLTLSQIQYITDNYAARVAEKGAAK